MVPEPQYPKTYIFKPFISFIIFFDLNCMPPAVHFDNYRFL